MITEAGLEDCTDRGNVCLNSEQTSSKCQDCDGSGSAGLLPCGRCAGSGIEPTSPIAAEGRPGIRPDFGAMWNWRSREWLLGDLIGKLRSGQAT